MKIDPTVYQKERESIPGPYDASCCPAHKDNLIDFSDECDHTSPWED